MRDRLIHEHDKLKNGKAGDVLVKPSCSNQDALFTKGSKKSSDTKKTKCFYCKKKGHMAQDCFKKKAGMKKNKEVEEKSSNASSSGNYASRETCENLEPDGENKPEIALASGGQLPKNQSWWIGASQHMSPVKKDMSDFVKFKNPNIVKLADNSVLHACGKGTVQLSVYDGIEKVKVTLNVVLYVPKTRNKLISLSSMTDKGTEVQFRGQSCKVMIDDKVYSIAHKHGKLYKHNSEPQATCCFGSTDKKDDSLSMWHPCFGHLNYDYLKMLDSKSLLEGLSFDQNEIFDRKCQGCSYGKQHHLPCPKKSNHECKQHT